MLMQAATNNAKNIAPSGYSAWNRSFCWRQATKDKTAHKVERYLVQFFGDHPIEEITHFEIQLHLNRLAKDFFRFDRPARILEHQGNFSDGSEDEIHCGKTLPKIS
jgi:hypothetical protein